MAKNKKVKMLIFLHILLFSYSFCGVFSKLAAKSDFLSLPFILFYGCSIFILGIYAFFWQQILKRMDLTVAFLNKAIMIIWGIVWGALFFRETITLKMLIGAVVVMIGVIIAIKGEMETSMEKTDNE